jgi:hypothetical protein
MKNNNILEALGLINNPSNMSMPNAKNTGLPINMSIPNDPRYNNASPYVDPSLMQEVREMLANEGYNNILGLNENEDYNGNPDLNQEIKELEGNENTEPSIIDALNLKLSKGSSSPQKEYSFERGIEKALSRIKDIRSQLNTNTNNIDPTLTDEQSGIALRRAMAAAHQADMAKPWRSSGTGGFIHDLSNMMIQGLGGYDTSKQQMLKENEEKARIKKALEMQQDAIARAIEKELYSRDYDKEKLAIEREKIIADKDFKRQQQESLNDYRQQKLKIEEDKKEDHKTINGLDFIKIKTPAERTDVSKTYKATGGALEGYQKILKEYLGFVEENVLGENEKITKENKHKLKESPIKYLTSRAKFAANEYMQKLPFTANETDTKIIAKWNALKSEVRKDRVTAENALRNGGVLPQKMYEDFEKNKMLPDLDRDNEEEFLEKMNNVIKALTLKRDVAKFSLDNNVLIDSVDYLETIKGKTKKEVKNDAEENKEEKDERFEKYLAGQK